MPRLGASPSARPVVSRPAARPTRARVKKIAAPQDRLSLRRLFWRRLKRNLRPILWLLCALAVLATGGALIRSLPTGASVSTARPHGSGLAQLAADAGLRLSSVQIHGATGIDAAALQAAIGVQPGQPMLGFSISQMQRRVAALGAVRSVTVQREFPGTLVVNITQRAAYAIWQTGTPAHPQFVLIDKSGRVIADQNAVAAKRREPWLLLLTGADAPQHAQHLMDALRAQPTVLAQVAGAERVDGLRWNLLLKDQSLVKLPVDDQAAAIAQLASLQAGLQLLTRPVEVIDLRQPGRLVVRTYPAQASHT